MYYRYRNHNYDNINRDEYMNEISTYMHEYDQLEDKVKDMWE